MNPLFFGTSREPLYGVYHAPRAASTGRGVVICAPVGIEYMRTHRALQKLATQLARAGVHAFRFDYFGSGDSAGAGDAGSPARWLDDIAQAADELRDNAGIKRVSLAGLRTGATLAVAASKAIGDIDALMLWDPVVDGARYVDEQLAWATPAAPGVPPGVHGFPFPQPLQDELRQLDLTRLIYPGMAAETLLVTSHTDPDYDRLVAAAAERSVALALHHIPSAGDWEDLDRLGAALLPQEIIRGLVSWAAREGRA